MLVVSVKVTHALGVMEARLLITAIDQAHLGTTDCANALSGFFINQDQTVVARVRYHQKIMWESFLFLDA